MLDTWFGLPVLFVTGAVAGWMDSIAGGGGLITVPILLNLGLPPAVALGTNKLQATFGSGSATWSYGRAGLIGWRDSLAGVAFTLVAAATGALCVQLLRTELLRVLVPFLLIGIAVYRLVGLTARRVAIPAWSWTQRLSAFCRTGRPKCAIVIHRITPLGMDRSCTFTVLLSHTSV